MKPQLAALLLALAAMRPACAQQPTLASIEARHTHAAVEVETLGAGMQRVYIFLPASPAVTGKVPFVFFAHGWQGMNPKNYGALLDHLAREGNVVIFPVYQLTEATSPHLVVAATAEAERVALAVLRARSIEPDPRRVVYFGYSMGAAISLKLATAAHEEHLPGPQALVLAAPGDAYHVAKGTAARSIWPSLKLLPATLPIAILTGEDDKAIGLPTGRKLAAALCDVTRADRRVLLILPGDAHGGTTIHAGHGSPGAPDSRYDFDLATPAAAIPKLVRGRRGFEASDSLNQLDFFGYWRVLDAIMDSLAEAPSSSKSYEPPASVFQQGSKEQTYLGDWPDGTPYKPAHVENPCHAM